MRPVLTLLGTVLLLASIYAYTEFAQRVKNSATSFVLKEARGEYSATITCTLDCAANPDFDLPAIEVRLADQILLARQESLPRMTQLVIESLPQVVLGRNEVIVLGNFAARNEVQATANEQGCLRIQIFQDGAPIAEQTFWTEPGQPMVVGAVMFDAATETKREVP